MREGWLDEAVGTCGLLCQSTFPVELTEGDLALALRLTLVPIPQLTTRKMCEWLASKGKPQGRTEVNDAPRHGCLMARAGGGIIFCDSLDDENERRFTVAHEVSHFVLDHLLPRRRAVRQWGPDILPVLDGKRVPTTQDRFFSVLEQIPIGVQTRLMDRNEGIICWGSTMEAEQCADYLSFELLAPMEKILPLMRQGSNHDVANMLVSNFGFPPAEAMAYVRRLRALDPPPRPLFLASSRPRKGE